MIATPTATRLISVAEYHEMIESGALTELDRVELIRGGFVDKMPANARHIRAVMKVTKAFHQLNLATVEISPQNAVTMADSEPEPDVAVLRTRPDYGIRKPCAADALVLIEIADSSLAYDLNVKGPLYAENGVPEYWVIDLNSENVIVHRDPQPDGTWAEMITYNRGETLTVSQLPNVRVTVEELLP